MHTLFSEYEERWWSIIITISMSSWMRPVMWMSKVSRLPMAFDCSRDFFFEVFSPASRVQQEIVWPEYLRFESAQIRSSRYLRSKEMML